MSDTSLVFNLVARDRATETLGKVREKFDQAATGIAAGVAGALGVGVAAAMDMSAANAKLATQLGIGPEKAAELSKVAANVYAGAWGDSAETVNDAIRGVYQNIGDTSGIKGGLQGATKDVLALSEAFDVDLAMSTKTVGQLMKTGLAKDAGEAMDLVTWGMQHGLNASDDFLDTLNEYSPQFQKLGLDGKSSLGLLNAMMQAGVRDSDAAADAIKEFGLRSIDTGQAVTDAYKGIGLDADEMRKKISAGGPSGAAAMGQVFEAIKKIKDPIKQNQIGTALMGTQWEDTVRSILPNLDMAKAGIKGVEGSTERMSDTLGKSPAKALERFKRGAITKLAEISGGFLQFAMDNQSVFLPLTYTLMGLAATVLIVKGAMMTYSAVSSVVAGANALISWSGWGVIGTWLRMMAIGLMAYLRIAAGAVASALTTAAAWTGSALVAIGTWVARVIWAALTATAQFLLMAARAVAWAAVMAAQWLIAMGPVGWVIAVIIGLVALIIANWDTVKRWTLAIWDFVWKKIKSAVTIVLSAVAFLGRLPGMVSGYFSRMKDAAIRKALELAGWIKGLPGRISSGLGSLSDLLVSKGADVVRGLWSGIQSMGGWIVSKISGWAKSVIPGPIAKALGISSPSKVTKAQGRWIARGLIDGLTGSAKQVRSASAKLADIVADSLAPGKKRSRALGVISSGTAQLIRLATQEASLAARMKKASKSLADQVKARAALAADVKKGILDAANITQNDTGKPVTADDILGNLMTSLGRARKFATDLAALRKKGVRSDLIAQIAQAGVEQGSATASALARADKGTIKQINSTQGALVTAATRAGAVAGDAMYGAGIRAAQGLVKGLAAQQSAIEKQMMRIAQGMKNAIKKALGIRSPSALMADQVGRWIPPGVVKGIQSTAPQLDRAMSTLVRPELAAPARPLTAGMAPLMGAQAGGGAVVVRLEFVEGEFKKLLRKTVRVDGRGSVQILTS